ncbi:hypothetical protein SDC9_141980 [bioreactor metagenome]|uniref:Uncharacterized protein n=1 Tax=bioreactor metagenome TaxID=1076179 RepID=A0A645E2N1_9ZZZZ
MNRQLFSIKGNGPAFLRIDTEYCTGCFSPSGSHKPGYPKDFSFIHIKIDISYHPPCTKIFHRKDFLPFLCMHARKFFFDFSSNHVGDDLIHRHLRKRFFQYEFPVTHNCYCIDNMLQFIQAVAYVNNSTSLCFKFLYQCKELIKLHAGQGTGRLVHNQDLRLRLQCLGDFYHLLFGYSQIPDDGICIDIYMQ